jgi:hypothetical protein
MELQAKANSQIQTAPASRGGREEWGNARIGNSEAARCSKCFEKSYRAAKPVPMEPDRISRSRQAWNTGDMFPGAGRRRTGESMTSTTWLSFQPTRICSENINGPDRAQKLEQVPKRGSIAQAQSCMPSAVSQIPRPRAFKPPRLSVLFRIGRLKFESIVNHLRIRAILCTRNSKTTTRPRKSGSSRTMGSGRSSTMRAAP